MQSKLDYLAWFVMLVALSSYLFNSSSTTEPIKNIAYSDFLTQIEQGSIQRVVIQGHKLHGSNADNTGKFNFKTTLPDFVDNSLLEKLAEKNVNIEIKSSETPIWLSVLVSVLPWLLIIVFFMYSERLMRSRLEGSSSLFGFFMVLEQHRSKCSTHSANAGVNTYK